MLGIHNIERFEFWSASKLSFEGGEVNMISSSTIPKDQTLNVEKKKI